jgi:L-alanine-DL-glutamate epimerase-like enolase superfamily enzyme
MIDVGQPDPQYGGGLLHCMLVARRLEAAGLKFNPHWPRQGAEQAPLIHLCAAAPSLYGLQEYRLQPREMPYGHSSSYKLERGVLQMPDEPGFGVSYDPKIWESATRLSPS